MKKNSFSKLLLSAISLIMVLSLFACGTPAPGNSNKVDFDTDIDKNVTYETFGSYWMPQHNYQTMPIAGFNGAPIQTGNYTDSFITKQETFANIAESGMNTIYGLYEPINAYQSEVLKALNYCSMYNLSYLPCFSSAHTQTSINGIRSAFASAQYSDALGGVIIRDEPSYSEYEAMAVSRGLFEQVIPNKLYHSNLFPTYARAQQLYDRNNKVAPPAEGYTYQQYVDDYIEIFNPQVLSYDFYPLSGNFPNLSNGYFNNMSIIRKAALEANIPFWVYVPTCSYNKAVRIPTQSEIDWLVSTSLSYGCKGIQYFTCFLPIDGGEVFNGAIFDRSGNKTEVFDYVKKTNAHIKAVDYVLMRCISKGIVQVGLSTVAIPESDKIASYGGFASASGKHSIIGCFDFRGKTALYVTNNSISEAEEITLNFTEEFAGYIIKKTETEEFGKKGSVTLALDAGEGALVVLQDK